MVCVAHYPTHYGKSRSQDRRPNGAERDAQDLVLMRLGPSFFRRSPSSSFGLVLIGIYVDKPLAQYRGRETVHAYYTSEIDTLGSSFRLQDDFLGILGQCGQVVATASP